MKEIVTLVQRQEQEKTITIIIINIIIVRYVRIQIQNPVKVTLGHTETDILSQAGNTGTADK